MNRIQAAILFAIAVVLATVLVLWSVLYPAPTPPDEKIVVVTSIEPLKLAAEGMLGSLVEYRVLLEPGVDPLLFEPDEKTLAKFQAAAVLIIVGNEVDSWALSAAKKAGRGDLPVIRFSDVLVYGVPPGGVAEDPSPGPDGKRSVDALGRPFVPLPSPYVVSNTESIRGREALWLDPVYAGLFLRELSVRIRDVTPRVYHQRIKDRAMLVGNNITSMTVDFSFRFKLLAKTTVVGMDDVLEPLARRYDLTFVRVPCVGDEQRGLYCASLPTDVGAIPPGLPVFVSPSLGLDVGAIRQQVAPRALCVIDPMSRDGESGKPEYFALVKGTLGAIYEELRVAGGVK